MSIYESHGMNKSPEHRTWSRMKNRCHNPKTPDYSYYGGRGITVCEKWRYSFMAFYEDMGERPEGNYSLDRINNDGNYEPGNCRWTTRAEQSRNRRLPYTNHTGIAGVGYHKTTGKWQVVIKHKYIGIYETLCEAYQAYGEVTF